MVLGRARIALLAVLTAASVSLSSEAGAVGAFGPVASAGPASFTPSCVALGTVRAWLGIPEDRDLYAPCLDGGARFRLRGPHGLKLEPASAQATDEGISYVMPVDASGQPGAIGLMTWRDVRGVDVWRNEPSAFSVTTLCGAAGIAVGFAIAESLNDDPTSLGAIPAHFAVVGLEALPFGALGYFIGRAIDPKPLGHWVDCESLPRSSR
ncbi:MAG: hypothetical protein HZA61_14690 [Candidatus Eisenbacteria bacterium]|uniref:Uncharacterized protein n=1 Tax=Eiseniibacteriota bacterium TaxID=2212470 RepID=A0A933SFD9_UNCEI|nr:hypothetical protein [Candidatus Eisenbacteria bacterium]